MRSSLLSGFSLLGVQSFSWLSCLFLSLPLLSSPLLPYPSSFPSLPLLLTFSRILLFHFPSLRTSLLFFLLLSSRPLLFPPLSSSSLPSFTPPQSLLPAPALPCSPYSLSRTRVRHVPGNLCRCFHISGESSAPSPGLSDCGVLFRCDFLCRFRFRFFDAFSNFLRGFCR